MSVFYKIDSNVVNVRSSPSKENNTNIITTLSQGEIVSLVDNTNPLWFKVSFIKNGNQITGFIFATLLEPVQSSNNSPDVSNLVLPPEVHFKNTPLSNRNSVDFRHCPLGESNMPIRTSTGSTEMKIQEIYQILNFLSVETSIRYLPINNGATTYCNIYAYDVCFLGNVYIPRVWWTDKALLSIQQGNQVSIVYGETVRELRANDLFDWLKEWGDDYGWVRTFDLTELQNQSNQGRMGIICAKRLDTNRSGHIVSIVPETANFSAQRNGSTVIEPLQSQAGVSNKKIFNNSSQWWTKPNKFREFGFWYHA
jgi:Bacterial SH3 domain